MTPADMARIHRHAFSQQRPWSEAEFDALIAQPHTHLTSTAQGFALWRGMAGEAELLTIAVLPDAQRAGIGTDLMQAWMTQAARNCEEAFLEVAADNHAARALYEKCGFGLVATRSAYYARPGSAVDALVMRAALR